MKRLGILAGIFIVLLAGGAISANLLSSDFTIHQTTNPSGSVFTATPDQATAFFLVTGFIVFNVLGAGLTLAGVFWLLNRQVKVVQQEARTES